jgi:hypothetical protein
MLNTFFIWSSNIEAENLTSGIRDYSATTVKGTCTLTSLCRFTIAV